VGIDLTERLLTGLGAAFLIAELLVVAFLRDGSRPAADGLTFGAAAVCLTALAALMLRATRQWPTIRTSGIPWRALWIWGCYAAYALAVTASSRLSPDTAYPHTVAETWWLVGLAAATAVLTQPLWTRRTALAVLIAALALLMPGILGPKSAPDLQGRFLRYDGLLQWGAYPEIGLLGILGAAAALAIVFTSRTWTQRVASTVLMSGFLVVPVAVNSRGAIVAFLGVAPWVLLTAAFRGQRRFARVVGAIGCVAIVAVGIVYRAEIRQALQRSDRSDTDYASAAVSNRATHWRVALDMTKAHPWLGIGPGRFSVEYGRYSSETPQNHAHNMPLHVAAETGLLGCVPFLILWGHALVITWRAAGTSAAGQAAFVLHAMLAAFFARSMTDQFLSNVHSSLRTTLLVAILLGLAEAAMRWDGTRTDGGESGSPTGGRPADSRDQELSAGTAAVDVDVSRASR
jgi:O-antigen ligase